MEKNFSAHSKNVLTLKRQKYGNILRENYEKPINRIKIRCSDFYEPVKWNLKNFDVAMIYIRDK